MGWNTGYTIFEATVVGAYDLGKLDKEMLTVLMEPYRDSDIGISGARDLQSKDGKGVEQLVIETWGLEMPTKPPGEYYHDHAAWSIYECAVYRQFRSITKNFNWR